MSQYSDNPKNDKEQQFQAAISDLPKEITPERDLWPGIEQAINKSTTASVERDMTWSLVGKVAASFAPVALVLGLWWSSQGIEPAGHNEADLFSPIAASFDIQKRRLLMQVSDETSVVGNWQQSLAELELAEQALLKALQSQPEDPALMKMLVMVYQQQLDLIRTAHKPKLASKFSQI